MNSDLFHAMEQYQNAFGDLPSIFGLTDRQEEAAVDVLLQAVSFGHPLSHVEFFQALGVNPDVPEGAKL